MNYLELHIIKLSDEFLSFKIHQSDSRETNTWIIQATIETGARIALLALFYTELTTFAKVNTKLRKFMM